MHKAVMRQYAAGLTRTIPLKCKPLLHIFATALIDGTTTPLTHCQSAAPPLQNPQTAQTQ